ncbi:B12-binding domain-containing radical SAM protein [bacterium]|nr:B12-binding domain-containing radical SAM protein [bacterium]
MTAKSKKIVLYNPVPRPSRKPVGIPLSLLYASRLLVGEGYDIKVTAKSLCEDPVKEVITNCCDAICFGVTSMTGYQIIDGLKVSRLVKKKYPYLPIVWGGWHPSLEPLQTVSEPCIDLVVKGQGERTFAELVHALESGSSLKGIPGLVYKEGSKAISNPDRPLEDMNNFPSIPFHLVNIQKCLYTTEFGFRTANYVTSQGCPYRCGFCCEQTVNKRRWAGLDAKRVIDDFERLIREYGVDGISINDSDFFVNKKRVKEICRGMIDRGLKIGWGNVNGRTRQLLGDEELWELLERSVCYSILTGAESGHQPALDLIHKDILVEDTIEFAKQCSKHHIKVLFSFLTGLPWPGYDFGKIKKMTDEEIGISLQLVDKLLALDKRHRALFFNYAPYPGTPLYQKSLDLGFEAPANLEGWGGFDLYKRHTPWVTPKQEKFIEFLSSYIFLFLDVDTCPWVSLRIPNRYFRQAFTLVFKLFAALVRFRWRYKFFNLRLDYRIFMFFKKINKWI